MTIRQYRNSTSLNFGLDQAGSSMTFQISNQGDCYVTANGHSPFFRVCLQFDPLLLKHTQDPVSGSISVTYHLPDDLHNSFVYAFRSYALYQAFCDFYSINVQFAEKQPTEAC